MDLVTLSDETLLGKVQALAETERFTLIDFLIHLGELDHRRDACQRLGYSSIFSYLTRHIGYAECDAMRRVRAARAARRFPSILGMIARGELHLVGISMISPLLTPENYREILGQVHRKTHREIEQFVAQRSLPAAEPHDRARALPPAIQRNPSAEKTTDDFLLETTLSPIPVELPEETRRVFTFAGSEELHKNWLQARDLLRHKFPQGKMEEIFGEALQRLLAQELPGKATQRKANPAASGSRRVPRRVKDAVWRRDGGRCSFMGPTGIQCGETGWLEYDHKAPWALGGKSEADNIRLLCRSHNQAEGRRHFGALRRSENS